MWHPAYSNLVQSVSKMKMTVEQTASILIHKLTGVKGNMRFV